MFDTSFRRDINMPIFPMICGQKINYPLVGHQKGIALCFVSTEKALLNIFTHREHPRGHCIAFFTQVECHSRMDFITL